MNDMTLEKHTNPARRSPWRWIPTLYFAEGIPNVIVMTITVIMYKRIGLNNGDIALYTAWLYLPWVIKPFWSPIVEMLKTKRWWITAMQLLLGAAMAGVAFTLPTAHAVQWSLALFWLMAFSSATHDIAADGFYMLALDEKSQAFYVGIRSTFYRIATIAGQGLMIMFAGVIEVYTRNPVQAWSITFWVAAGVYIALYVYHRYQLPFPASDVPHKKDERGRNEFLTTICAFFKKPEIVPALAFMLLYRFPEALLTKICPLFLLDPLSKGGLGLTTLEIGIVQGTIGVLGLTIGGILGGIVVSRGGWKRWFWPMVWSISLPNIIYVFLAYYQPTTVGVIATGIFIEQFGYGFGFTAYMLYLMSFSQGTYQTAHYAFCTGFMALGLVLPGMFAGWLQESVGYLNFFIIVMALVPITFIVSAFIKFRENYDGSASR